MTLSQQAYPRSKSSILIMFDVRIPRIANRLHRLRAIFQEYSDIEAVDQDHYLLIIRPGAARRLLP